MSGYSNKEKCPRCGRNHFVIYEDWKPFIYIEAVCLDCGFRLETSASRAPINEIEEERNEYFGEDSPIESLTAEELDRVKEFDAYHFCASPRVACPQCRSDSIHAVDELLDKSGVIIECDDCTWKGVIIY